MESGILNLRTFLLQQRGLASQPQPPAHRLVWLPALRSGPARPLLARAQPAGATAEPQQPPDTPSDTEPQQNHDEQQVILQRWLQRTRPAPILSEIDVFTSLKERTHWKAQRHFKAFYSSELGGIVTDPALMVVHIDDHMVHRGHAVFDTAELTGGHLYCLDAHFQRFLNSAAKAGIELTASQAQMYRIILETAAASRCVFGSIRYWLSAGRGDFALSPKGCFHPTFYCMAYTKDEEDPAIHTKGLRVRSSPVPAKDPFSATVKSTNYLLNALNVWEAEEYGCDQGIFVDENDSVLEGPNMNVGIITQDDELVVPTFERTLQGITLLRLMDLLPQYMQKGTVPLTGVSQRPFTKWEALQAKEVFLCGSSIKVRGVTQWDDSIIGHGRVGEFTMQLNGIITEDMEKGSGILTAVPYGYLTASGDWVD